jgi:tetratricopeptide (TPR) repeat protein
MKYKSLVVFIALLVITACTPKAATGEPIATAIPASAQGSTPEATPTATLSPAGQVARDANQWQKDLMDPSIAIGKLLLTIAILVIVAVIIVILVTSIISPMSGNRLARSIRKSLSRLREPQTVIVEFENGTDEGDHLVKIVRALLAENLRALFLSDGPFGNFAQKLREILPIYRPSRKGKLHKPLKESLTLSDRSPVSEAKTLDLAKDALQEVGDKVSLTEIKWLAIIVRYLFPVPGISIGGHLIKAGTSPQNYGLVAELADLATGELLRSKIFWSAREGNSNTNAKPGKANEKETISAEIYGNLAVKAALWVANGLWIEGIKNIRWRGWDKSDQAEIHNLLAYQSDDERLYEFAIAQCLEAINKLPKWYIPYWTLGDLYSYSGEQEKSIGMYEAALGIIEETKIGDDDKGRIQVSCACSRWLKGTRSDRESALKIVKDAEKEDMQISADLAYNLACFYTIAGRNKDAFKWLDKAMDNARYMSRVQVDPDMEEVRKRPEYRKLMARHAIPVNKKR